MGLWQRFTTWVDNLDQLIEKNRPKRFHPSPNLKPEKATLKDLEARLWTNVPPDYAEFVIMKYYVARESGSPFEIGGNWYSFFTEEEEVILWILDKLEEFEEWVRKTISSITKRRAS